jgi:uncharacterized lipoprotein YmbA
MKCSYWMIGAALTAGVAGCGSSPALHYYALDPVTPVSAPTHPASGILIHVRHISVPQEMDHLGLTHQLGSAQLSISDNDRWSAPLGVLVQGTLTRDLGERLGYDHVVAPDAQPVPAHSGPQQPGLTVGSEAALDIDFVALSADDTCGITAQVNWTFSVPAEPVRRGTLHVMAPATGCPAGLPTALSTALGDLADQLVQPLSSP